MKGKAVLVLLILKCLPISVNGFQQPLKYTPIANSYNRASNGNCCLKRQQHSSDHLIIKRTTLFLAKEVGSSEKSNNDPDGGKKKRRFRGMLQKQSSRFIQTYSRFVSSFKSLSKKAKRRVITQLVVLMFVLGISCQKIYKKSVARPGSSPKMPVELSFSNFMDLVEKQAGGQQKSVSKVGIDGVRVSPDKITYRLYRSDGESSSTAVAFTRKVHASPELIDFFRKNELPFTAASQRRTNVLGMTIRSSILAFYCFILFKMYKSMNSQSGNSDVPGKVATSSLPLASFSEIQGIDEAKTEVMELVDTLRNPQKYAILGARAPTGLLLEGPPGTGKTMLARATASSAGFPLLYCSGSDFVEMFVGRGAARIRRLFEKAQKLAPCIIFIDELDTLGKARDSGGLGGVGLRGNDEAEQTLNQLLTCMDGLDSSRRICVLAATNRKEVLDSALIRPGRFDRIVKLTLPGTLGRERILRVHSLKLPGFEECSGVDETRLGALGKGEKVDLSAVATITEGLSGAELEFVVNEAAIRAVRRISAELMRQGNNVTTTNISPRVLPEDFEASVKNYFVTRKPKNAAGDFLKNVWK